MANEDRVVWPKLDEPLRSLAIAAHDALHKVWSKSGTTEYNKQDWRNLDDAITALIRFAQKI